MKTICVLCLLFFPIVSYATSAELKHAILMCESGGKHYENGHIKCNRKVVNGRKACGIAQFQERTFDWMLGKAKGFPYKYPRWSNKQHQLWLFNWALDNGLGYHWECYRKLH